MAHIAATIDQYVIYCTYSKSIKCYDEALSQRHGKHGFTPMSITAVDEDGNTHELKKEREWDLPEDIIVCEDSTSLHAWEVYRDHISQMLSKNSRQFLKRKA